MLLHCGAELVDLRSAYNVPTPSGIETWYPLAHAGLIHEVESQLRSAGFQLTGEHHALSHEGARYFGLHEVRPAGPAASHLAVGRSTGRAIPPDR